MITRLVGAMLVQHLVCSKSIARTRLKQEKRINKYIAAGLLTTCLLCTLLLSACDENSDVNESKEKISWDRSNITPGNTILDPTLRLLNSIPCHSPCYEGLIPGKTNKADVLKIMEQSPVFGYVAKNTSPYQENFYYWNWYDPNQTKYSKSVDGRITFSANTDNSNVTSIRTPNFAPITLETIFKKFGEPNYIIATVNLHKADDTNFFLIFIYLDNGFLVSGSYQGTPPTINSILNINNASFFIPGKAGLAQYTEVSGLKKWEGFKDFSYYCTRTTSASNNIKIESCDDILKQWASTKLSN